ncbi:MAG: hypothetical protein M0Z65_06270 [Firmicutes bacterium]|uniref:Uncharacterized protein n=1 Tax=Melghirimyces thermohalophilus TaxID=1236220 RepID=A0A1G6N6I9_9BACL|nr:hypothetical protein [Melghirimyces thermohalophilus]MDA8352786.1 hypothetical protein [Bacillota bacterium]SDC63044.1 hypothetical protein SAMN04488112_1125 [Melghirimyces thermohalophilus]
MGNVNVSDVTYMVFELIVKQLEEMPEEERLIQRVEVVSSGLEVALKSGEAYRINITPLDSTGEEKERMAMTTSERATEVRISTEDWDELVHRCDMMIRFLEYDKRKMEELSTLVPDFPWDKRSQMIDDLLTQLQEVLARIDPGD